MKRKKRGRKKVCETEPGTQIGGYMENSIDVTDDKKLDFGEVNVKNDEVVSFGNLSIGVTKVNAPKSKPLINKITSEHNLCEIIIPENLLEKNKKPTFKECVETDSPYLSGEYRAEEDYLLNIPKYKKKKKYHHKSILLGEDVFPLFETMSEHLKYPLKKKTNIHCWWCCHRFDCTPKVLPTKYDKQKKIFEHTGNFCSWACTRSYTMNDSSFMWRKQESLLSLFIFKLHKKCYTGKAPPRQFLKMFGGNMSIHEFREASEIFEYTKISEISSVLDRNIYLYYKKN